MGFTPEQIKGRIKSVAKQNNADARTLMRIYMMERFLERLAQSEYRDNFIIKGGILVTATLLIRPFIYSGVNPIYSSTSI